MRSSPILDSALSRIVCLEKCRRGLGSAIWEIPLGFCLLMDANYLHFCQNNLVSHHFFLISSFGNGFVWILWILLSMAGSLFLINGISSLWNYLFPCFGTEALSLTQAQMDLLGLSSKSPGFKLLQKSTAAATTMTTTHKATNLTSDHPSSSSLSNSLLWEKTSSANITTPIMSPINSPINSPMNSRNESLLSSSWTFHHHRDEFGDGKRADTSSYSLLDSSAAVVNDFKRTHYNGNNISITDQASLTEYLKDFEAWENTNNVSLNSSGPGGGGGGEMSPSSSTHFWNIGSSSGGARDRHYGSPSSAANASFDHYSPLLKKYTYQLSTSLPGSTAVSGKGATAGKETSVDSSGKNDDKSHLILKSTNEKELLSLRLGIDPLEIVHWTENLRLWISSTVLVRLVNEIDSINKSLINLGLNDSRIGEASLDKIKRISTLHSIQQQNIPTLSSIIPFLEITPNQEYLVNRIRELSQGGAMGLYRWNAGGRFKGADWNDKLITDAEIIMHVIACYFDSRLPPNYDSDDGRTFSSLYFFKSPDKPDPKKHRLVTPAIVQSSLKPPYYYLQVGDTIMEVGSGRNNLFHTVLSFLHHIKTKDDGMVGRINFGISGVNILWTIE